jgi:hypothetical protein
MAAKKKGGKSLKKRGRMENIMPLKAAKKK